MRVDPVREIVLPRLNRVRKSGAGFMACCPAHEDSTASLSIAAGKDQPIVFHCHAGCRPDDIIAALSLTWEDLSKPREASHDDDDWTPAGPAVAKYDYVDEEGRLLFQVLRTAAKEFPQRAVDHSTKSGWRWKLGETRRVLYRLPNVTRAVREGRFVHVCEGEKDVHTVEALGLVATCNPGGAGPRKWREEYSETLRGAAVIVFRDRDDAGRDHADRVRDALLAVDCDVTVMEAAAGKDITDHVAAGLTLADLVAVWPPVAAPMRLPVETDVLLAEPEPEYDWLVPELLERGDRLIVTGPEGGGKSTLLRQIAIQLAAGLHPFNADRVPPMKVLFVDLENSRRQIKRKLRPLRLAAASYEPVPGLYWEIRPEGLDLLGGDDGQWLLQILLAIKPDLLITGPIYKLANGDPTEERTAKTVTTWLDRIRKEAGCAIILEAHSPHAVNGHKQPERPYGASLWKRWPEFGLYLSPEGHLRHWRGPRDERAWPAALHRGGEWPWTPVTSDRDLHWLRIVDLCTEAGDQLSTRDLAKLLGVSQSKISRLVADHRLEWESLAAQQDHQGSDL